MPRPNFSGKAQIDARQTPEPDEMESSEESNQNQE
jgi:hypothetical protein